MKRCCDDCRGVEAGRIMQWIFGDRDAGMEDCDCVDGYNYNCNYYAYN